MRFRFCPDCGAELALRPIGDEGPTPFCESCGRPWFDMFSSCAIALVINDAGEALLLEQGYISTRYKNLVSGYLKPGETAESAAAREIYEETGLKLRALRYAGSFWFAKKDLLMIGFFARAEGRALRLSAEVDGALWVGPEEALTLVHPAGSVSHALIESYLNGAAGFSINPNTQRAGG